MINNFRELEKACCGGILVRIFCVGIGSRQCERAVTGLNLVDAGTYDESYCGNGLICSLNSIEPGDWLTCIKKPSRRAAGFGFDKLDLMVY